MRTVTWLLSAAISTVVLASACGGGGSKDDGDMATYTPTGTGPAASLRCTSSGKNAFDTFGATAFVAVNESIFTNVTNEVTAHGTTNLGGSFTLVGTGVPVATTDGVATFKGKLAAFLVYVYGGPDSITYTDGVSYTGNTQDMVTAHTGLAITADEYDYFVMSIVVPALTANGVTTADVSSCFAPAITSASFMASVVGH
jgi:hypothetical protein